MSTHKSSAIWQGNLQEGKGKMDVGMGSWEGNFSAKSRFEGGDGTSPEELIAAAHAGCFSMAFSLALSTEGYEPEEINTNAEATIEKTGDGFSITSIHLNTKAKVSGIEESKFKEVAEAAKKNCPVSKALAGVNNITLEASLEG